MNQLNAVNQVTTKAGLTGISGAATTFSTGAAVVYSISGKAYSKATVTGGATPTTDGNTGNALTLTASQAVAVLFCLDASGTVKCLFGTVVALDSNGNFTVAPPFPAIPDTLVPFAYVIATAGSTLSGTFTWGSSNWNITGMSYSVQDILTMPDRPQTA